MFSDIAAWLFALFIIDTLQAEMRERHDAANVPLAEVQQSRQCIAARAPHQLLRYDENAASRPLTSLGIFRKIQHVV